METVEPGRKEGPSLPLVRTWLPDDAETRETVLTWWKCAKPRGRVRERSTMRALVVVSAISAIGVGAAGFPPAGVGAVSVGFAFTLFLSVDRWAVHLVMRRTRRLIGPPAEIRLVIDQTHVRWYRAGEEHGYEWSGAKVFESDQMIVVTFGPLSFIGIPRTVLGEAGATTVVHLWTNATTITPLPVTED